MSQVEVRAFAPLRSGGLYAVSMGWRTSARHVRPRARGPFLPVETALESDVALLRAASYSDYLELVRLSALVDGLYSHVGRLSLEIPELRRELHAARTAPAPRDPLGDVLVAEVLDLRATVSTQQALLADVTRHVLDLLAHLVTPAPTGAVPPEAQVAAERPGLAAPPSSAPEPVVGVEDEVVKALQLLR
jgi:hypothetical protein